MTELNNMGSETTVKWTKMLSTALYKHVSINAPSNESNSLEKLDNILDTALPPIEKVRIF